MCGCFAYSQRQTDRKCALPYFGQVTHLPTVAFSCLLLKKTHGGQSSAMYLDPVWRGVLHNGNTTAGPFRLVICLHTIRAFAPINADVLDVISSKICFNTSSFRYTSSRRAIHSHFPHHTKIGHILFHTHRRFSNVMAEQSSMST